MLLGEEVEVITNLYLRVTPSQRQYSYTLPGRFLFAYGGAEWETLNHIKNSVLGRSGIEINWLVSIDSTGTTLTLNYPDGETRSSLNVTMDVVYVL